MYSMFQNQKPSTIMPCLPDTKRRLVLSCLLLLGRVCPKIYHSCICPWHFATLFAIGLHNVTEKYYICAKCEVDSPNYWKIMIFWHLPNTQKKQDETRPHRTRLDDTLTRRRQLVLERYSYYCINWTLRIFEHGAGKCICPIEHRSRNNIETCALVCFFVMKSGLV